MTGASTKRIYKFKDRMFGESSPYYPNYEAYKNHLFMVSHVMKDVDELVNDHVWLICISDYSLKMDSYVHLKDLKVVGHSWS